MVKILFGLLILFLSLDWKIKIKENKGLKRLFNILWWNNKLHCKLLSFLNEKILSDFYLNIYIYLFKTTNLNKIS